MPKRCRAVAVQSDSAWLVDASAAWSLTPEINGSRVAAANLTAIFAFALPRTRCGHLYCWGCLYTWLCRQKSCPTCKDYCDEDRIIPVYCRDAETPNNELQTRYTGVPPRPSALRLLMPTPSPTSDTRTASRNEAGEQRRRPFSFIPSALRRGSWLRNLSLQHQVLLKQLLFFLGSVLILLLLLW